MDRPSVRPVPPIEWTLARYVLAGVGVVVLAALAAGGGWAWHWWASRTVRPDHNAATGLARLQAILPGAALPEGFAVRTSWETTAPDRTLQAVALAQPPFPASEPPSTSRPGALAIVDLTAVELTQQKEMLDDLGLGAPLATALSMLAIDNTGKKILVGAHPAYVSVYDASVEAKAPLALAILEVRPSVYVVLSGPPGGLEWRLLEELLSGVDGSASPMRSDRIDAQPPP